MIGWHEGDIVFDDLRLEKAIGEGAYGEVWRARQLSWEKDVAVKRVKASDPARIRSMEQEAIHWLEIGLHPYVTTCYYTRRYEGAPVIVLEYASEGALDRWLKDGKLLFEEHAAELIMKFGLEAAWGLTCAHRTGLLHLDVKPANILVENGMAKITDFGIASRLGRELASSGTMAYASPEQLAREGADEKADVFSWAVTMFAMFRHEVDWAAGPAAPEALKAAFEAGTLPLAMPGDVYHLLLACMAEDPALRPSMEDAADDLAFILQAESQGFSAPKKVIDRQPLTSAEYNNRAIYLYETGESKRADEFFKIAMETAANITVPQYNKGLADYFAGRTTPAKLLEEIQNKGIGSGAGERSASARLLMLNGDARSIAENPGLMAASPAAEAWLGAGAPGALAIEQPHPVACMQPEDREKLRIILTEGGLKSAARDPSAVPVESTVSFDRKTLFFANDKGAFLLGGLGRGAAPWATCMIFRNNLRLASAQFLGGDAILYGDDGFRVCDFSDPENLVYSEMPGLPELKRLGSLAVHNMERLGNVSCLLVKGTSGQFAILILDLTHGVKNAGVKVCSVKDWMGNFRQMDPTLYSLRPDIAFCADGSVLINGSRRVAPEEWGGKRRETDNPIEVLPSCYIETPLTKIAASFGTAATFIRHSAKYHCITDGFDDETFEHTCLMRFSPLRFFTMAFDESPGSGASLVLEHRGEVSVARVEKSCVPPPDRAEWLTMKAVSGAVAKSRRDVVDSAAADYDMLVSSGAYGNISSVTETLRPLLEIRDERALALWQRIARDFPRGAPFFATECEAVRTESEISYDRIRPKPLFTALPFSRPSGAGKIRFSFREGNGRLNLVITNGMSVQCVFPPVGLYRFPEYAEGSDDGLLQTLVYGEQDDGGKLIAGRRGVLFRVFDVRREPRCVFEKQFPGLLPQEFFARWTNHTLLLFLFNAGLFALDFEGAGQSYEKSYEKMPQPIIPDIIDMHDVAYMGAHADELFTGENRWRLCFEILPYPARPLDDPRLENIKAMLPKKPDEKRAMLLRNGFGNLWTEQILQA